LNGKGLFNPHTIGERETGRSWRRKVLAEERGARPMDWNRFFEDERKEMRDEGVEMIRGFESEEVKKLLSRGTLRTSSDDTEHNLERQWRKHNVVIFIFLFGEQMFGDS
jgi:hypothetical protein